MNREYIVSLFLFYFLGILFFYYIYFIKYLINKDETSLLVVKIYIYIYISYYIFFIIITIFLPLLICLIYTIDKLNKVH